MARNTERDALPTWSAHTLVMTLLEGDEPFNGHCTCDRWSYRTDDWADLGARWAWHYVAESDGPDGHPSARAIVRRELEAQRRVRRGLPRLRLPGRQGPDPLPRVRAGRRRPETTAATTASCNCCWEETVARRHARDAAHQRVACSNCGNCLDCDEPGSPDHEDCICPLGQAIPVEVAA